MRLTNTEYFRQEAIKFQEKGYYCNHPDDSPQGKAYWNEQARRSIHGYKREDGIWITGYHYFYLNFSPIIKAQVTIENEGEDTKFRGERIEGFPDFWDGDYKYFHYLEECENQGTHAVVIKSRRKGYSFKGSAMLCRNYFLIPKSKSYAFAHEKEYLTEDGLLTKAWDIMDFLDSNSGWSKRRDKYNQEMHRRASYTVQVNGVWVEKGFKSEVLGLSLRDNWGKARGKAAKLILWEEAGHNRNLWKAWNVSLPSMKQGKITTGLMVAYGTGGSQGADFMSLEDMFTYPGKYEVQKFPYDWDHTGRVKNTAFFCPESWNRSGCMDKNGNSDVTKAELEVNAEIEKRIKEGANSEDVARYMAEHPLKPAHAMMKIGGTIFPVDTIRKQVEEIEDSPREYRDKEYWGKIIETGKGFEFKIDRSLIPINEFPLKDLRFKKGGYCIWELPIKDDITGEVPQGIYIAGNDPYDDDNATNSVSLGSMFILNILTDRIVAEYTGRPETADEFYENCYKLLALYNAKVCYERNKKGFYAFMKNKNLLNYLALEPKILKDQNISKANTIGNNMYGFNASTEVNKYAREEFKKYMLSQAYGKDEGIKNITTIRSLPLLKEAMFYNDSDNFDRISSIGGLMIYRAELKRYIDFTRTNGIIEKPKEEDYFTKNYQRGNSRSIFNTRFK